MFITLASRVALELHIQDTKISVSCLQCLDYNDISQKGYQWNYDEMCDFLRDLDSLSIERDMLLTMASWYLSPTISIHHPPFLSIIHHFYPSSTISIHHPPFLSIIHHLYPSPTIFIHHPPFLSILHHFYPSPTISIHHPPFLSITHHFYSSPTISIHHPPFLSIIHHFYPSAFIRLPFSHRLPNVV